VIVNSLLCLSSCWLHKNSKVGLYNSIGVNPGGVGSRHPDFGVGVVEGDHGDSIKYYYIL